MSADISPERSPDISPVRKLKVNSVIDEDVEEG